MDLCRWCGEPEGQGYLHDKPNDIHCVDAIPFSCPECRKVGRGADTVAVCVLGLGCNFYVCKNCGLGFSGDMQIMKKISPLLLKEI